MNAEQLSRALRGCQVGAGYMAPCPSHDDRQPSLSLTDGSNGTVLVYCHAGCSQNQVIDALRSRGLWETSSTSQASCAVPKPRVADGRTADSEQRFEMAMRLWQASPPAEGTVAEEYLRRRGLMASSARLRFCPALRHPSGGVWRAMLALVTDVNDQPTGLHRTYINPDGSGKAPVSPPKMMLGRCQGGAVRLAPHGSELMVSEGIENALSGTQVSGKPAWAALSTSGLRGLELPPEARDIIILADGDDAGEQAARAAALRWTRQGRVVRIAKPPTGLDFNDLLLGRTQHAQRGHYGC